MSWTNQKALMKVAAASALLFVCGYFTQPGFAGEGDSPLEAYFLPHRTELTGSIGADFASDYYKVIVPATGRLVVRLYDINLNDEREELNISLIRLTQNSVGSGYTAYLNYVAESKNSYTTPDVIDIPDLPRGIYFVQVWPQAHWDWDGANYKIASEFSVFPPVVSDDIGDKKEYALPTTNQLPTICTLSGNNDVDFFECHVPYNTNLTVSLTGIDAGANVDLEVYTAWDTLIGSATQSGAADELLYLEDLVPGQYFIKIFGKGTTQYTFTAIYDFAEASDILDDVGDNLTHSMPLLPGNPSVFCLQPFTTDSDFFSIYQPEDGPLTVRVYNMFFWDEREDLYLRILDEYGNVIAHSDNGAPTPEHIEVSLPRGQYFIAVYGKNHWDFDGAIYTINVETSGYDVGDAFNRAMQIHAIPYGSETYGYPYIGMIDRPGDVDFFQLVLKDNGFIYLEVDKMLHSNVDVQLFDAYNTLLQTSANLDTQPEAIYVDGLGGGVYFIKVYSPDKEISQYRLTPTIGTLTSPISDDIGDDEPRALTLVPYTRVNGYIWNDNSNDYFKFNIRAENDWVRIHVNNLHVWESNREDIQLYIYDESGAQIGFSDNDVFEDELVLLNNLDAGAYYAKVALESHWDMDPVQYSIIVETDTSPLPSAGLYISADVQGVPGEVIYVPVVLDNTHPDEISSMSIGIQFDPDVLEPLGVSNSGITLEQWNAQVRYARSINTISVSMDNYSTLESGELLNLIFKVSSTASIGDTSTLTVLVSTLNGAIVPWSDGLVTVTAY